MYFLNEKEEKVIGKFLNNTNGIQGKELNLIWNDGSQVYALYDSYIEDELDYEIDEDGYEEFWSFVFKVMKLPSAMKWCFRNIKERFAS